MKLIAWLLVGVVSISPASNAPQSIDSSSLDRVGSALHLPSHKTICLELSRELNPAWPILNVMLEWNKNGVNTFTTDLNMSCDGTVIVTQSDSKDWWGSTEFYSRDLINVQLSVSAPHNRYLAIVCHELGHVLGLPHSSGDGSCMDHNQNNPEPTELDLKIVGKDPWSSPVAQRTMLGVK